MNVFNHIKSGARIAPPFLILLYYLALILDLSTTWLASPDLKYEGNWIVRHFNLNWSQIIIMVTVVALFTSSYFLIGLNYLHRFYRENMLKSGNSFIIEVLWRKKLLISSIGLCCFYAHLFYSYFVCVNNYLHYIYLFRIENILTNISTWYINKIILIFPHMFAWYQAFFITAALILTVYKIRRIGIKYRTLSISS